MKWAVRGGMGGGGGNWRVFGFDNSDYSVVIVSCLIKFYLKRFLNKQQKLSVLRCVICIGFLQTN